MNTEGAPETEPEAPKAREIIAAALTRGFLLLAGGGWRSWRGGVEKIKSGQVRARQQKFVKDNRSHLSAVRAERIVTAGQYQEHDAAEASQSRQESIAQHHGNAW